MLSGCTTQSVDELWANEDLDNSYAPAKYGEVQVYQKNALKDVLITYEEDHGGKIVKRAFFVLQDGDRTDNYGKPAFVSPKVSGKMELIPSDYGEFTDVERIRKQPLWARVSSDNSCVMILTNGISAGSYELPSYSQKNIGRKLALTPGAILFGSLQQAAQDKLTGRDAESGSADNLKVTEAKHSAPARK